MDKSTVRTWKPISGDHWRSYLGRFLSVWAYPALFPFAVGSWCGTTTEDARWWRTSWALIGTSGSIAGHLWSWRRFNTKPVPLALSQLGVAVCWDMVFAFLTSCAHQIIRILAVNRSENRLLAGRLHGPRVLVVGNGPSAVQGKELGDVIDKFDEVVRFNNFQNKITGMEKWVGKKTTVHFSDGVLYPTYTEYHVPGATVMLSLFTDRLMVAGTYLIQRMGADLQFSLTLNFLKDPDTTWIEKEAIERLKKDLKLSGLKHPTSGMLAIDHFMRMPNVQLPVIIHGFDFFQGPTIHYYHDNEPLWERMNNQIGVNQHSPHLEKIYVEELIKQGKVKFLKDL